MILRTTAALPQNLIGACNMDFTQDQINNIVREARDAAYAASDEFFQGQPLPGQFEELQ